MAPVTRLKEMGCQRASMLDRRRFLAAGFAVATVAGSAGRGFAQTPAADGWSFVDDKDNDIRLDHVPQRILADLIAAAALWDFGVRPVGVFGWDVNADDTFNVAGGRLDPTTVEVAGNINVPFDAERAISTSPDLIITLTDGTDDPDGYWSIEADIVPLARQVAPILAINPSDRLDRVVARFAELAVALGVDGESAQLTSSRQEAEQAAMDFAAGTEDNLDLTAMFIASSEESLYIANPKVASDLIYFRELGLSIPDLDVADNEYWEMLSWEQSLKYPVDLVFYSTRTGLTADELKAHPAFGQHPAVLAGQLYAWNGEEPLSYQGITTTLNNTLVSIEDAKPV